MKAVQITENGDVDVLQVRDLPIPTAGPGQVVVKNDYAGVNFIDTYQRSGLYKIALPAILGREGAGVVESVGPDVSTCKPGDRVAYFNPEAYAEYTNVNQTYVYPLPPSISTSTACASILQGLTALSMCKYSYPVKKGDFVLIHAAAGGTGSLLVQICKHFGATVIGTVSTEEKAQMVRGLGADHVVIYSTTSVVDEVNKITNNKGVQAVFDGVGKDTFDASLKCLGRRGVFVSFGNASGKAPAVEPLQLPKNSYLTRPSLFNSLENRQEFEELCKELFELIENNVIHIKVHKVYELDQVKQAHLDLVGRKTTGKLLVKCKPAQ
ncbi:quinone oxidoreductase [Paraphysoderma sedebokerense]|nr:quinone oxidoreductase [Paraphysoderma sedebokerense]